MESNKGYILVTGANGEVGHGLIKQLPKNLGVVAFGLDNFDEKLKPFVTTFIKGDITDRKILETIVYKYRIDTVYHLAAILSTSGEKNPELAHEVNVGGTYNLLSIVNKIASKEKRVIKFIFPSTIAVYGMTDLKIKKQKPKVNEDEFLNPITMYGANKLYCENLGIYFSTHYQLLTTNQHSHFLDFRCVRFPGLISAETIPSGGTSDFAPEMLHFAAQNKHYQCFVRPDSTIHFMAMPDAIRALLLLTEVSKNKLTRRVYNISGFSASAKEIENIVKTHFPKANIFYKTDPARQRIIDSWSENVDDSLARKDWGWKAKYGFKKAFNDYLIPAIKRKYRLI